MAERFKVAAAVCRGRNCLFVEDAARAECYMVAEPLFQLLRKNFKLNRPHDMYFNLL